MKTLIRKYSINLRPKEWKAHDLNRFLASPKGFFFQYYNFKANFATKLKKLQHSWFIHFNYISHPCKSLQSQWGHEISIDHKDNWN